MIYKDKFIRVEREDNELPWVKIFAQNNFRELSDCDETTRTRLFEAMMIAEQTMIKFYAPTKINIASFGNYVPQVHIHVIARFENDSFFPESVWGKKQRENELNLPNFDEFAKILSSSLRTKFE
ncbi:HIT family protein [Campylobacter sp. faydin G-24]|uniref:HIT family protein n=1 Tax=Campylobacter anatolicus TaxID=2829105 RepID=A0ABS5HFB6_9BACT|nr:HIT family protein [Campylobacter anatolicus]MBR8462596.1 HIT family protein [Campylobacter anatolicus]MBR8462971.1 HIT family protein [Campylobacter anatolicus]MBR8465708.1 HIT family protein [Campylobacter anatolicus]